MSAPRGKTLQQHLGFDDPDLRSPAHDAMVLWINDHVREYIERIQPDPLRKLKECRNDIVKAYDMELQKLTDAITETKSWIKSAVKRLDNIPDRYYGETPDSITAKIKQYNGNLYDQCARKQSFEAIVRHLELPEPPVVPPFKVRCAFEETVTTDRSFIVGFIDVTAYVRYPVLELNGVKYCSTGRGPEVVSGLGGKDCPVELVYVFPDSDHPSAVIYFEAKPVIRSLGELLRQIRTYQEYLSGPPKPQFVVVSPDVRFRAAIESQGIDFWESPRF